MVKYFTILFLLCSLLCNAQTIFGGRTSLLKGLQKSSAPNMVGITNANNEQVYRSKTYVDSLYQIGKLDTAYINAGDSLVLINVYGDTVFYYVSSSGYLLSANNLSDVANVVTARNNILPSKGSNSLKYLRVNVGETDYELVTIAGGGDLLSTNNLSDLTNAGTARTNLGLAIGTNVQAYDADITTYGGITPSANVQTLLGSADYSAFKTFLSLQNVTNESKATMFTNAIFTGTFATAAGAISNAALANGAVANLSGTNSGDNAVNTLYSGLVSNATHTGDATGATALTVVGINSTNLAALATGILKNTTGTGVPSIATAGVDYLASEVDGIVGNELLPANNLSDVSSATTSRNNILPSKTGNTLKVLRVNAGETDYELATISGGGLTFKQVYAITTMRL